MKYLNSMKLNVPPILFHARRNRPCPLGFVEGLDVREPAVDVRVLPQLDLHRFEGSEGVDVRPGGNVPGMGTDINVV